MQYSLSLSLTLGLACSLSLPLRYTDRKQTGTGVVKLGLGLTFSYLDLTCQRVFGQLLGESLSFYINILDKVRGSIGQSAW